MEKDKMVLKKSSSSVLFIEPLLSYKNIYKWLKMMYKKWCKNRVEIIWNKSLIDKNKAYRMNIQLLRMMKERQLIYIPLGP